MARVVLAMSGGVDSSVAAHLLLEQGHEVVGVFMRHGEAEAMACSVDNKSAPGGSNFLPIASPAVAASKQGCCSAADAEDGRRVAERLDIPFYAINLQEDFGRIIDYFVDEYASGRTPNPCVVCNTWLKFGKLFEYADSIGAQFVATGHYARLTAESSGEPPALRCGLDPGKDQSYVLFGVATSLLSRMLLPVGEYQKPKIREIATSLGLKVAEKKDSQEICFVAPGEHPEFVRGRRHGAGDTAGEIVTTDGQTVGRHDGIEGFTIGQRKGLGGGLSQPHFVVRIEAATRRVVIGLRDDLAQRELTASRTNWLINEPLAPLRCLAKFRYNTPAAPALAEPLPEGRLRVIYDEPQFAIAPGQAVVCYEGDRVLGGGWID